MPWEFNIQGGHMKCIGLKNMRSMQKLGGNYGVTTERN